MSEPYVPQLIYYPERDEYEFVTEDAAISSKSLTADDAIALLFRLFAPRDEPIGFRIAGALVRRVSPLSDGDGWSDDMSKAPRDGTPILGFNARMRTPALSCDTAVIFWDIGGKVSLREGWWGSVPNGMVMVGPTHWRPLPSHPHDEVA